MEHWLHVLAEHLSQVIDGVTLLILAFGSAMALWNLLSGAVAGKAANVVALATWQGLSRWLVVGLEFMLVSDLIATVISPGWDDLGKLGAIAAIRTVLGFFLGRDLEAARRIAREEEERTAGRAKDAA